MTKKQYLKASDRQEALGLYGSQLGATELIYKLFGFWDIQRYRDASGRRIIKDWDKVLKPLFKMEGIKFKKHIEK